MGSGWPWFKFSSEKWLSDGAIRACDFSCKGLWTDMLCYMDQSPRRGFLLLANGTKPSNEQLTKMVGGSSVEEVQTLLKKLSDAGVSATDTHGILFCPWMVKDEAERQRAREAKQKSRKCHGNVTPKSRKCHGVDLRPKNSKTHIYSAREDFSAETEQEIARRERPPPGEDPLIDQAPKAVKEAFARLLDRPWWKISAMDRLKIAEKTVKHGEANILAGVEACIKNDERNITAAITAASGKAIAAGKKAGGSGEAAAPETRHKHATDEWTRKLSGG